MLIWNLKACDSATETSSQVKCCVSKKESITLWIFAKSYQSWKRNETASQRP